MAPVAYFFLPDTPDRARFLTEEQKVGEWYLRKPIDANILKLIAKARGVRQVGGVERVGGIVWKEVGLALLDAKCWFTAVSNFPEFFGFSKPLFGGSCFLFDSKADFVQLMYFSCNVGFSSLPGRNFQFSEVSNEDD